MRVEHLGEVMDIDPLVAAFENAVIRALRKYGPTRQTDLWYRSGAQRVGREVFHQAIENLVTRDVIRRQTTNRRDSFILRMAPDKLREQATQKAISHESTI